MVKPATKTVQIPAALIDAFAEAKRLREEFAPTEATYQKLYKELKALTDQIGDDQGGIFDGEKHTLEVSARGMERTVDVVATRKKLGAAAFMTVVTVTQSALNGLLPKPEVEALLVESQTGSRKFTTSARDRSNSIS